MTSHCNQHVGKREGRRKGKRERAIRARRRRDCVRWSYSCELSSTSWAFTLYRTASTERQLRGSPPLEGQIVSQSWGPMWHWPPSGRAGRCEEEAPLRWRTQRSAASGAEQRQTQLLPWGAPSAKAGSAPSVLQGRGAACKRRRDIVCMLWHCSVLTSLQQQVDADPVKLHRFGLTEWMVANWGERSRE